jgi:hypothetical protein
VFIAGDESCTPQFISLAGASMSNNTYCTLAGVPPANLPQGPAFFKRFQQRFRVQVQLYAPSLGEAAMVRGRPGHPGRPSRRFLRKTVERRRTRKIHARSALRSRDDRTYI